MNIGTIGEIYTAEPTEQPLFEDDYQRCGYHLRRKVVWHKEASVNEDIHLSKMLRAQQTTSDITKYTDLIYRNLRDLYFIDGTLSLTLRKTSETATSLSDEVQLLGTIDETVKNVNSFLGEAEHLCIEKISAMSSPGFLQLLVTGVRNFTPFLIFQHIFKTVGGKIKSADGKEVTQGLPAIMQAISNLFNDTVDRDLKRAQVRKMDAETQKVQAETLRINMEAQNLALQNADALIALNDKLTRGAEDAILVK